MRIRILAASLFLVVFSQVPAFADHVHHLSYNNSNWQDQDLTVLTHGAIGNSDDGIAAFYTTPNQQFHVFFVDTNLHVNQLYYNGTSWSDQDLTAQTGGPGAYAANVSGFAIGNLQYVFYLGIGQHIHELSYNNSDWTDQDITTLGNGVLGNPVLVAFPTKPNNQFHVYYQDANAHDLHQLYFNGSSWSDSDLTSITGAYCPTIWMAGFATGNLQHILCDGYGKFTNYLDLLHIYYNNYAWVYEDITYRAGDAGLACGTDTGVAGFVVGKQGEAYDVTQDGHVHQYTYVNTGWFDLDLTLFAGAPEQSSGGITAFPTTPNNQFHIYYAPNNDVYQIYFNGTNWSVENLTGGTGQADVYAGTAGFAIGNLQHVFYFDTQN